MPMPTAPNTLGALQAMQSIIIAEALVAAVSPFAALTVADQARYGVARAVFIGRPKDFADAYVPQCCLWIPENDQGQQPAGMIGYVGRVFEQVEVVVQAFVDMRADWYAGEQQIYKIRDALWPVLVKHALLGGAVSTIIEAEAREGRGLCFEEVAGVQYRCYEAIWTVRQQYNVGGGRVA